MTLILCGAVGVAMASEGIIQAKEGDGTPMFRWAYADQQTFFPETA